MNATPQQSLTRPETMKLVERLDRHQAALLRDFHASMEDIVSLPPQLARLCVLGGAVALRAPGLIREFMLEAKSSGASLERIVEVVFLNTNYAGFVAMSEGLQVFMQLFGEEPFKGQDPAEYPEGEPVDGYNGPAMQIGIEMYGPVRARANVNNFRAVGGPVFAEALDAYAYAGVFRRRVLPPLDRELITIALLSCIERPGPFVWHLKAALRLGATSEQIRHAILGQTIVSGVLTAFRGIAMANPVIDDWRAHPACDGAL